MEFEKLSNIFEFLVTETLAGGEFYQVDQFSECQLDEEPDCDCTYCTNSYDLVRGYDVDSQDIFSLLEDEEFYSKEVYDFFEDYFKNHERMYLVDFESYENNYRQYRELVEVFFDNESDCKGYCDTYFD